MKQEQLLRFFSFKRIIFPILIGLLAAFYLVTRDASSSHFKDNFNIIAEQWSLHHTLFILLAIILVGLRDFAYMYRIRILTDKKISWKHSFQVIMMWEFASSLTPSVVGGSAVALYIVTKEGISAGKSTAIVMITALLDELFYIIFVPISILIAGYTHVFSEENPFIIAGRPVGITWIFIIGYLFIVLLTAIILVAIFIKPQAFKTLLTKIFHFKYLKRWLHKMEKWGNDLIETSKEMRGRNLKFWGKVFGATVFSWLSRFFMLNCLLLIINPTIDHFLVLSRQLVMWVILLISPTPGGSGIAEYAFPIFLGEFIPKGLSASIAILWRLLSYYPYIIMGSLVLPLWLKRVYTKKKEK